MYGLFSAVSLQKSVRDRLEGHFVTNIYFSLCWVSLEISMVLLAVGLWNAQMVLSEKGFLRCHSPLVILPLLLYTKMCGILRSPL